MTTFEKNIRKSQFFFRDQRAAKLRTLYINLFSIYPQSKQPQTG